jgi:hypothetical protein
MAAVPGKSRAVGNYLKEKGRREAGPRSQTQLVILGSMSGSQ